MAAYRWTSHHPDAYEMYDKLQKLLQLVQEDGLEIDTSRVALFQSWYASRPIAPSFHESELSSIVRIRWVSVVFVRHLFVMKSSRPVRAAGQWDTPRKEMRWAYGWAGFMAWFSLQILPARMSFSRDGGTPLLYIR